MPAHSKPQNVISTTPLNPMVFYARFSHISEKIFENLDIKSLENCRVVSKSWQECIDNRDILWIKIAKNEEGNMAFQLACKKSHSKVAKVLIQKSAELNIDLNAKDQYVRTAFHYACIWGHSDIAEMLMQKSAEFNIDLNAKDEDGMTAFHLACSRGRKNIVEMIIDKGKSCKIDLTEKDSLGRTGFQHAKDYGDNDVVNIIKERMPNIAF